MKVPVHNQLGEVVGHIELVDKSATEEEIARLKALFHKVMEDAETYKTVVIDSLGSLSKEDK